NVFVNENLRVFIDLLARSAVGDEIPHRAESVMFLVDIHEIPVVGRLTLAGFGREGEGFAYAAVEHSFEIRGTFSIRIAEFERCSKEVGPGVEVIAGLRDLT